MTIGGKVVTAFPVLHFSIVVASALYFIITHDPWALILIVASIYVFPLLVFRLHNIFWPLTEGSFDISAPKYNAWWASYQFQSLFIAFPILETPLHFIPGGFSAWLRLWGSRIGKRVLWTPRVEIVDRGLMDVGSHVVVGHIAAFCSHMIVPKNGKMILVVKKVSLGDGSFIGADAQFGPGGASAPGELVAPKSAVFWKGRY
jgi:acetyltransferase-like isoleucine patch superfamily enzyme